jgi:ElaB/YqjD/DUF883 family membrane-anchored ribosome-binding protein
MERTLKNTSDATASDLATQAGNLADTTRDALSTGIQRATALTDTARDALNSGMTRARKVAESASDWAAGAADTVSDASVRGYKAAEDTIRTQPMMAVGGALVAGLVLGALIFSRRN